MSKKLLSLALALVMCLGLTVPVLAADYTEVIPCKYERVGNFSEGLAAVAKRIGTDKYDDGIYRWGFIDKTGKEVISCKYVYPGGNYPHQNPCFSEGLAAMVVDDGKEYNKIINYIGKYCFIDKAGKEIIPGKYDTASNFSEGLAMVGVWDGTTQYIPEAGLFNYNFNCGFIDKTGKEVIPLQYSGAQDFSEGLAAVCVGNDIATWEWGFIDQTGKMVIPFRPYTLVSNFSEGLVAVMDQNGKWGFIDKSGKEVIPCQYTQRPGDFSEGLASVYVGEFPRGKKVFIDKTGKMAISAEFDGGGTNAMFTFSEGLAAVAAVDGRGYCYIDKTGREVFSTRYNSGIEDFSEGLAVVNRGGKYGYIDKTGKEVVPCQYAWACSFSDSMAAVAVKGKNSEARNFKWGFISVSGAQPTAPTVGGFTDVKTGDYFADPVLWAVEKKITAGTSATTFAPNATCTQSQILTFLWRAKGEPKPTGTVSGTQYYATAAQWAKEQGLTDNFSAEADCTRAMVVTYLWKLAGSPNAGTSDFTDVPANADYAQAVAWAVEQGITSGTGNGQFSPASTCTRGQIVAFLYRAFAK